AAQDKKVAEKKDRPARLPFKQIRLPLGRPSDVVVSADGKLMAVGVAAKVVVFKVGDGEEVVRLQLPEPQTWHRLVFGGGGKTLVWLGAEDKAIRIFDLRTGKQAREFQPPEGTTLQCISPDATRIVFTGKGGHYDVHDVATNKLIVRIEDSDSYYPIFTPDSKQIAMRNTENKDASTSGRRFLHPD